MRGGSDGDGGAGWGQESTKKSTGSEEERGEIEKSVGTTVSRMDSGCLLQGCAK